jgi:ATP-dependent DNA helicase RecQ
LRCEETLRRRGTKALIYHGDLSASERKQHQKRFLDSPNEIVLATNAFGMGVDKPDIRFVLHWQMPKTLEAYYQEIGRAGRDGKGSLCELLYCEPDLSIQREFIEWANPDRDFLRMVAQTLDAMGERVHTLDVQELRETFLVKNRRDGRVDTCLRLLRAAGCCAGELGRDFTWLRMPSDAELDDWLPDDKRERDLRGLLAMVEYAKGTQCKKRVIHVHFGIATAERCGSCDRCVEAIAWLDAHLPARAAARAPEAEAADAGVPRRGEWLRVEGLGLCTVLRVHELPRGVRVDVELHEDLSRTSFDAHRLRWSRVTR